MAASTKKNGDVLSKAARDYGRKVSADPKLAAEFLKKAGIITKPGKLAPGYR